MKKLRSVWLDDIDWRHLQTKIKASGFEGRGSFERFLEKVARCRCVIFLESGENVSLTLE